MPEKKMISVNKVKQMNEREKINSLRLACFHSAVMRRSR